MIIVIIFADKKYLQTSGERVFPSLKKLLF